MLYIYLTIYLFHSTSNAQLPDGNPFTLNECGAFPEYQQWDPVKINATASTLPLVNYSKNCFDCNYCQVGAVPHLWDCDPTLGYNQYFNLVDLGNGITQIQSTAVNTSCLQSMMVDSYAMFSMQTCDSSNTLQQFKFNTPKQYYISSAVNSSLCITSAYYQNGNCSESPYNTYPYCNSQLSTHERVTDLLSRMAIPEKINNLQNNNPGVPRLGVPPNSFHEALHGVVSGCGATYENNTGCPTSFPHATLLGATFNRTLWKHVAMAISDEARALFNQGIVGTFFWAPDINLFRDPRWGRGQETPGEDPFLTGQYVAQYAHYMENGEDHRYLKVVSTAKHYADYDQEGNYGIERGNFNANVSEQDQVEYYWPQWRSAIQVGGVKSIMCSYNAVNGMPSCGNDYFMNEIAREEWGFDGFFVSDCGALTDGAFNAYIQQTYNGDKNQQTRVAMEGGCDVECGGFYAQQLPLAYTAGVVTEDDIDRAAYRLYTQSFNLGLMDYPGPIYNSYGPEKVDTPYHRELALSAAQQGIVLLKNAGNILPLSSSLKIAAIGPHANATQAMLSIYRGTNLLVNSHSPYQAMVARGISVTYTQACNISCPSTAGFGDAVNAAKAADVAIVFLGLHPGQGYTPAREDEGWDRENITFVGQQLTLLQQVYAANSKTILVLINGGPIDISWPKMNVPGIIEAFYPGELGGDAITSILFGDVSPAGKLPVTIYDVSLTIARPSIMDMSLRNNGGITYRYYTGTPVYKFGFGLTYTNFTYKYYNMMMDGECIDAEKIGNIKDGEVMDEEGFIVEVTNTGRMASDCVVLGFVTSTDPDSPPLKLFDFQRVFVDIGQSVNVTLSISPYSISLTNKEGHERVVPGKYKLLLGDYQNDNYVTADLCIAGQEFSLFNLPEIGQRARLKKLKKQS